MTGAALGMARSTTWSSTECRATLAICASGCSSVEPRCACHVQSALNSEKVNLGGISTGFLCDIGSGVANRSIEYSRSTLACCLSPKDDGVPQACVPEASLGAAIKMPHASTRFSSSTGPKISAPCLPRKRQRLHLRVCWANSWQSASRLHNLSEAGQPEGNNIRAMRARLVALLSAVSFEAGLARS